MGRRRYWRVVVWGSEFGADGGLRSTPEEADDAVVYLGTAEEPTSIARQLIPASISC